MNIKQMMLSKVLLLITLVVTTSIGPTNINASPKNFSSNIREFKFDHNKVSSLLSKSLGKELRSNNEIGLHIVDLETGKTRVSWNSDKLYIPGSTLKILTTVAGMKVLGEKFKYETKVLHTGTISNGILKGDIYLVGTGDPFLNSSHLMSIAQSVESQGIKKITGSFYYDDTFLSSGAIIDKSGLKDQTYNSSFSALSSNFNRFIAWKGSKGKLNPVPAIPGLVISEVSDDFDLGVRFRSLKSEGEDKWIYSSKEKYRSIEKLPVRKASLYTAQQLHMFLIRLGVDIKLPRKGSAPRNSKEIFCHYSKNLQELSESALEYSNNLFAELILLRTAKKLTGRVMVLEDAAKAMKNWYVNTVSRKLSSMITKNGSGLNTKNLITPKQMCDVLVYANREKFGGRSFLSMLSASGQEGWMEKRLNGPESALRVWAKTGSLDYVSSIAGYLISNSNKKYAFSIFVNNKKIRSTLDLKNNIETYKLRSNAFTWKRKVVALQDEILESFISTL